jgi:hypothetical protein
MTATQETMDLAKQLLQKMHDSDGKRCGAPGSLDALFRLLVQERLRRYK